MKRRPLLRRVCITALLVQGLVGCGGDGSESVATGANDAAGTVATDTSGRGAADALTDAAGADAGKGEDATSGGAETSGDVASDGAPDTSIAPPKQPSGAIFGAPGVFGRPIDAWISATKQAGGTAPATIRVLFQATADGPLLIGYGATTAEEGTVAAPILALAQDGGSSELATSYDSSIVDFAVDGATVWAVGGRSLDSSKGSLYRKPASGPWQRFESLSAAARVDRVYANGNTILAAGLANAIGDQPKDHRFATIWRSTDGGQFFNVVHQQSDAGVGDVGFRHLFRRGEDVLALGVQLDGKGGLAGLPHLRIGTKDATPLAPSDPLKSMRPLGGGEAVGLRGLLGCEDVLAPGTPTLLALDDTGVLALDSAGHTLVATFVHRASGETVLLERDGSGAARVRVRGADGSLVTILESTALPGGSKPTAVAFWGGALLIATDAGDVLRSVAIKALPVTP